MYLKKLREINDGMNEALFTLCISVSKLHGFMNKSRNEYFTFSYLYYLQVFTLEIYIYIFDNSHRIPLMQSVTKYLARYIFLEDISNGVLWLFRIPLRLCICISDCIFHFSSR